MRINFILCLFFTYKYVSIVQDLKLLKLNNIKFLECIKEAISSDYLRHRNQPHILCVYTFCAFTMCIYYSSNK